MAFDIEYKPGSSYEVNSNSTVDLVPSGQATETAAVAEEQVQAAVVETNMMDIEYRPEIGYEESFDTKPSSDSGTGAGTGESENSVLDKLNDMKVKLDSLYTMSQGLPDSASKTLSNTLSGISYITGMFNPDYVKNPDLSSIEVTIGDTSGYASSDNYAVDDYDIELPDGLFPDFDDAEITVTDGDAGSIRIEKEFASDLTNVFADYVNKLSSSLSGYYVKFISAVSSAGMYGDYKKLLSPMDQSVKITVSVSQQMLLDSVIRGEIVNDQKMRLQTKLYNTANFVSSARAILLAKELRKRYYAMDYVVETSFADMSRNRTLSDLRTTYDAKYEESLYNLYKYLNSSVILLNETLTLQATTCEAKAALIKEGVSL